MPLLKPSLSPGVEIVGMQVGKMPSSQSGVEVVGMQILVSKMPSLQSGVEVVGMLDAAWDESVAAASL